MSRSRRAGSANPRRERFSRSVLFGSEPVGQRLQLRARGNEAFVRKLEQRIAKRAARKREINLAFGHAEQRTDVARADDPIRLGIVFDRRGLTLAPFLLGDAPIALAQLGEPLLLLQLF
jgi:hypothetical protein